jgi:hypothetical protein
MSPCRGIGSGRLTGARWLRTARVRTGCACWFELRHTIARHTCSYHRVERHDPSISEFRRTGVRHRAIASVFICVHLCASVSNSCLVEIETTRGPVGGLTRRFQPQMHTDTHRCDGADSVSRAISATECGGNDKATTRLRRQSGIRPGPPSRTREPVDHV